MTNRQTCIAAAILSLSLLGGQTGQAQANEEERAASVLFEQYETVASTRGDLFTSLSSYNQMKDVDSVAVLGLPFVDFMGALKALGPSAAADLEMKYSVILVGAKDFRPPQGIGAFVSTKCYIGILKDGPQPNVEPDFHHASLETMDGRRVWTWSIPPAEGASQPGKFYAAQIAGSYLLMANDPQGFQAAAEALTSSQPSKPIQLRVPGWDTFSRYGYWADRPLRQDRVVKSSDAGIDVLRDVIAITFFADLGKRESFVRVVSSDKSMKTMPKLFPEFALMQLRSGDAGTWQAELHLSKEQVANDATFQVFSYLGFGGII